MPTFFDLHTGFENGGREETTSRSRSRSFSSAAPAQYEGVKRLVKMLQPDAPSSLVDNYARTWGTKFFSQKGRWPSASDLANNSEFRSGAQGLASGTMFLPPEFGVDTGAAVQWFVNDFATGPKSVTPNPKFGPMIQVSDVSTNPTAAGAFLDPQRIKGSPIFTQEGLGQFLAAATGSGGGGSGGGGGGRGGGAVGPVFDRDAFREQAIEIWRQMLLEEPPNPDQLVEQYIRDATAFFAQGGRLEFDTFVRNKAREHPRYKLLYRHKPDAMPEQAFIAQFTGIAQRFGVLDDKELMDQGISSGASPAGFEERVGRSRPVQLANQGAFSQRFANQVAQLAPLMRL